MNKELKPCPFCGSGCILRDFSFTFSFFDTLYFVTILFSGSKKRGVTDSKKGGLKMYIMDQSKKVIHNTDFIQRFHIVAKSDAWLIISSIEHDKTPDTLGRYFTEAEAKSVLEQLFKALINDDKFFEMPRSFNQDVYERKRDARVKRKGGS